MLNHQLSLEKKERQDLVQENMRLVDTSKEQVAGLREELATAQSALRAADARRQEALAVEAAARTEVATHLKTAKEAREKYEMELRLHSQVSSSPHCSGKSSCAPVAPTSSDCSRLSTSRDVRGGLFKGRSWVS